MLTKIHHVGLVVRDLATAYRFWRDTLGLHVHKEATVTDQGVKAALLPCGETEIELLEPIDPDGGVGKFLAKRGEGLHHLCLETDDVATELATAKAKGLPMIDQAPRAGLAGMIGFLHPKASCGVLVEFAQPPPAPAAADTGNIDFDYLAIIVEDPPQAAATFHRNFGLSTPDADRGDHAAPVRMPLGRSSLHFYGSTNAPHALTDVRGLAGIGLRVAGLSDVVRSIRACGLEAQSGDDAGARAHATVDTCAHGVPSTLRASAT
jgi:methylmalonyl-CoA/ethylmalonyl-CoA epimerase